jgi:hypothetical protein
MSDKKISELTELTAPDGTEELVVNDSGTSKKITIDNLIADNGLSGDKIDGGTISNFTSTGIDDNATSTKITVADTGIDVTGSVTCDGFTSTGIDDNATSTAITIDSGENVGIGTSVLTTNTAIKELHVSSPATNGVAQLKLSAPVENMEAKILMSGYLGQDSLNFGLGNTGLDSSITRMSIGTTGDVTVNTGNLVIGTSGKGIDFSATSDGSGTMTSEVLDDYEEGTWTPSFRGSGTAGTYSYTVQIGKYVKIGKMVTVWAAIFNIVASSNGTGNIEITGLPYTVDSGLHRSPVGTVELDLFTFSGSLSATAADSSTFINLRDSRTGAGDYVLQVSDRNSDGSDINLCITYRVA